MKQQILYQCEICGTSFADKNKAKECEQSHVEIDKIKKADYRSKTEYPVKITVKFKNGKELIYKL